MAERDQVKKGVTKSQSVVRPASSPPGTGRQESLEESLKSKMTVSSPSGGQDARSTGAVAKTKPYKKTRHPTDPLLSSQNGDVRPKSPRRPSFDKKKKLSISDTTLQSTAGGFSAKAAAGSSGNVSPLSHSPLTPTHKKPTLSQSNAGLSASQQKIHILLSSSHSALTGNTDSTQQSPISGQDFGTSVSSPNATSDNASSDRKTPSSGKQNKGQRTPKKETKSFEPYMMLDQVQQGMKKGDLIEGVLRINPKNYQDAYISVPGERMDICVCGIRDRNRALNGDVVVVQLKPVVEWKILFSDLSKYIAKHNLGNASLTANKISKKTREVLMTIEKNLSLRAGGVTPANAQPRANKRGIRRKRGKKNKSSSLADHSEGDEKNDSLVSENGSAAAVEVDVETNVCEDDEIPTENSSVFQQTLAQHSSTDAGPGLAEAAVPNFSSSLVPSSSCPTEHFPSSVDQLTSPSLSHTTSDNFLEFPVIDNFKLPDGHPNSVVQHNWDVEAANTSVAILQLADLFTDCGGSADGGPESLSDLIAAEPLYGDDEDGGAYPHSDGQIRRVVAPDELSEAEDSCSDGGPSHCSNEARQAMEDAEFYVANFSVPKIEKQEFLENRYFPVNDSGRRNLLNSEGNVESQFEKALPEMDEELRSHWRQVLVCPLDEIDINDLLEIPKGCQFIQKMAKVVYISEQANSRLARGHLKLMADKNPNWALFVPNDHRFPRMMIQISQCPNDFFTNHQAYSQLLFIARLESWTDGSYARGFLCDSLGPNGNLGVETMGILIENGVRYGEFDQGILSSLPKVPWTIPKEELSYRRDFRNFCVFTIDPATARDLDDAVSCEELSDGLYRVGVHIADVSFFLREGTKLDDEASKRATSIYMVQQVIPMLPRLLCEQLCSLQPGEDRLAFSVLWTIREDGAILDEWFGRSVINSCVQLSYEHAQRMIENSNDAAVAAAGLPRIHDSCWTVADIGKRVRDLNRIAAHLRRKRTERGNLRLDQIKLIFDLGPVTGLPVAYHAHEQKESNKLIEEFMLLANMAVAHRIYRTFPELAILRNHPPPQDRKLDEALETLTSYGIHLDGSSSESLQKSLELYQGNDDLARARMLVIVGLLTKPMNRAKYFCSGKLSEEDQFLHYALNVPLYTHFTSPIRRYPDVMVHRLLAADLGYLDKPSGDPTIYAKLAGHCNTQKQTAKTVQEQSDVLFMAAYIQNVGGMEEPAMVCAILDRSFDVQLLNMGIVKRIYCEQLPLLKLEFLTIDGTPRLNLIFKPVREGESPFTLTVMLFTMVKVMLKPTPGANLKFDAHLKLPSSL